MPADASGTRRQLEDEIVRVSHALRRERWVANHDGNVTARLSQGRFLATPTAVSKADVHRGNLIVVDEQGKVVSGSYNPFSELALHLAIYRARPDVRAVIHAHPPTATGLSVAGIRILPTMLAEPVVSLGGDIPLVPYAAPKTPEWTSSLIAAVDDADAVVLEHHGVFTFGPDLETAYLRMELVEHLARIQLSAHQAGLVREIPKPDVERLLGARTKAGLGKAARESAARPVVAARPAAARPAAMGRSDSGARGVVANPADPVKSIIVEEIGRALKT